MADFQPLHPDKPGANSPRNVDTRKYRALRDVGPFKAGEVFTAWPYGETFAWVHGMGARGGPRCKNSDLKEWVADGFLELIPEKSAA